MILAIIYFIISAAGLGSLMYFTGLYTQWYWYWIVIVGLPLGYVILYGLTLIPLFFIAKRVDIDKEVKKPSKVAMFFVQQVNHLTIRLSLSHVKYSGLENFDQKKEYMIIYNHMSNFDPMLIMDKVKRLICITKRGNKKIPVVGGFIHKAGYITIDRENNEEGIKAINKAIDVINNHQASIAIAPEGTRSKSGELLPFHAGTFNIAKRTGVPIVCVGLKNTNKIHKNFPKKFTRINYDIIYVMRSEEYSDMSTSEIANKLHTIYEQYLGGN